MTREKWPTEDGSEYVLANNAVSWESDRNRRLFDLYCAEMDRIGGPEKRVIEVADARACYMNALASLLAELAEESRQGAGGV